MAKLGGVTAHYSWSREQAVAAAAKAAKNGGAQAAAARAAELAMLEVKSARFDRLHLAVVDCRCRRGSAQSRHARYARTTQHLRPGPRDRRAVGQVPFVLTASQLGRPHSVQRRQRGAGRGEDISHPAGEAVEGARGGVRLLAPSLEQAGWRRRRRGRRRR
ncbi:hypothetical protein T492DRAFT_267466 [Pavlovales sp. CCMP2436]|nr:hypothetical protein T492DRAFT_267466 [Pavlovales sp. CCMP2436]